MALPDSHGRRNGNSRMVNHRKIVIDSLIPYFRNNPKHILLVGDMGFGAINSLRAEFPDRVFNLGIMEQGMVGIAAGLALGGEIPIVYSIVNFLCFRAIEQIRNDVLLQGLNVKFIGTGANDYFKFLGRSHTCGTDDIKIMKIIGMQTFNPYEENSKNFEEMIKEWMLSEKAGYLRV